MFAANRISGAIARTSKPQTTRLMSTIRGKIHSRAFN